MTGLFGSARLFLLLAEVAGVGKPFRWNE